MPLIDNRTLSMNAIYWALEQTVNEDFEETYAVPRQIKCLWAEKTSQVITADETEVLSGAFAITDEFLDAGGFLLLGGDESLVDADPRCENETRRILTTMQIPNLCGKFFYKVMMR